MPAEGYGGSHRAQPPSLRQRRRQRPRQHLRIHQQCCRLVNEVQTCQCSAGDQQKEPFATPDSDNALLFLSSLQKAVTGTTDLSNGHHWQRAENGSPIGTVAPVLSTASRDMGSPTIY